MTTGISRHGCQEKQERSFQINISLTGPQDLGGMPAQWSPLTGGQFPSKASGHRYQESQSSEKYDRSWFQGLLFNRWSSSSCSLCLNGPAGASLRQGWTSCHPDPRRQRASKQRWPAPSQCSACWPALHTALAYESLHAGYLVTLSALPPSILSLILCPDQLTPVDWAPLGAPACWLPIGSAQQRPSRGF